MMVFQDLQLPKVSKRLNITLLILLLFLSQPVIAQYAQPSLDTQQKIAQQQISRLHEQRNKSEQGNEPLMMLNGVYTGNNPHLKSQLELEKRHGKEVSEGYGYRSGTEPSFPQIQFYEYPEPSILTAQIETLLHGITVSLPPKYDMYGYELRRYMSEVAGVEVMVSQKRLAEEVANTKRAKIILEHWGKNIMANIDALGTIIEADDNIDPAARTSYKYYSGRAKAFILEANSWVDNNQAVLELLFEISRQYEYRDPYINFVSQKDLNNFARLFRAREKSLRIMQEYPPFRMMIY